MKSPSRALIGLGTNLPFEGLAGPALLEAALRALEEAGLPVLAVSSAWRTEAWPDPSEPAFTNAVVSVDPGGRSPDAVYALLDGIEKRFGRIRSAPNAPRTLDLDLLDQDGASGVYDGVILPHYAIAERAFVLEPLREIDPNWAHPSSGAGVGTLLAAAKAGGSAQRIGSLRIAPQSRAD